MSLGVDPFYVFDGKRSPLKHDEDNHNSVLINESVDHLTALYIKADPNDFDLVGDT